MSDLTTSVIYYSATGHVHALAQAVAEGAEKAGSDVRLRRVGELAPDRAIAANEAWAAHAAATADVPVAEIADLEDADAVLFGTPTRYGMVASQLKQFIDSTGRSWQAGALQDKVYGAFVSTATAHGGHESTLLSLYTVFAHWGGVIVPPGYTDPIQFALGNPYGTSSGSEELPDEVALDAARYQGRRAAEAAAALRSGVRYRPMGRTA